MKTLKLTASVYGNKIKTKSKFSSELEFTYYMFEFYRFIGFRTTLTIYFPEKGEHIYIPSIEDGEGYSTFPKDEFTVSAELKNVSLKKVPIYTVDDYIELYLTVFKNTFNTLVHIEK